jgi:phosphatidate cytidylyltransferase
MNPIAWERLFGFRQAFQEPAVVLIVGLLVLLLAVTPPVILLLARTGRLDSGLESDLWRRYRSWLILAPIIALPVLLGAAWTILGVTALSLLCFGEFAAATGLFRDKLLGFMVTVCILSLEFAVADHWYRVFVALTPMSIVVITAVATSLDRPQGYIQRVALAIFGFILFGTCLGHLAFMANDTHYRSLILMLVFGAQLNDVFAFVGDKALGGPKLVPQTSPEKTVAGALGSILLTTLLVYRLSGYIFTEGRLAEPVQRWVMGLLISIAGQVGDLTVAAIKRDIGIAETRKIIPGHGGVLDRANSLLLSAPALFHFVNHFGIIGGDQPTNLFTGGG